jgi:hypothetical protein
MVLFELRVIYICHIWIEFEIATNGNIYICREFFDGTNTFTFISFCEVRQFAAYLSIQFHSGLIHANFKFENNSLKTSQTNLLCVILGHWMQLRWNPGLKSCVNYVFGNAIHIHPFQLNWTRNCTEFSNSHLQRVFWQQFTFLHLLKCFATGAFGCAIRMYLLHLNMILNYNDLMQPHFDRVAW